MRKQYYLDEESVEIIKMVREKYSLPSDSAALKFFLKSYANSANLAYQIVDTFDQVYRGKINNIYRSVKATDRNIAIAIEVINTILKNNRYDVFFPISEDQSHILEAAKAEVQKQIEKNKQRKDSKFYD